MSALVTIKGRLRKDDEMGKNFCRRLRLQGQIPANLMENAKSTPIMIDSKLLSSAWKNDKTFQLALDGSETKTVLIKELQIDPIKRKALHVDLMYA